MYGYIIIRYPDTPYSIYLRGGLCIGIIDIMNGTHSSTLAEAPAGLWLPGNEGMEKKMEITIMGYMGTTIRIHYFIPS